jgi:hypothetical protein
MHRGVEWRRHSDRGRPTLRPGGRSRRDDFLDLHGDGLTHDLFRKGPFLGLGGKGLLFDLDGTWFLDLRERLLFGLPGRRKHPQDRPQVGDSLLPFPSDDLEGSDAFA